MANDTTSAYLAAMAPAMLTMPFPSDRLEDTTPSIHKPASVLSRLEGINITGTIIAIDDPTTDVNQIDVAPGRRYYHQVRNVRTYSGAAEQTWGVINVGDPVYYDDSATMPAAVKLSTSPLDAAGAANPLFGFVVWAQDEVPDPFQGDRDPYPTTTATASTETDIVIAQVGISGGWIGGTS